MKNINESRSEKIKSLTEKYTNRILKDIYDLLEYPNMNVRHRIGRDFKIQTDQLNTKIGAERSKIDKYYDILSKRAVNDPLLQQKYKEWWETNKNKAIDAYEHEQSKIEKWYNQELLKQRTKITKDHVYEYKTPFLDSKDHNAGAFNVSSLKVNIIRNLKKEDIMIDVSGVSKQELVNDPNGKKQLPNDPAPKHVVKTVTLNVHLDPEFFNWNARALTPDQVRTELYHHIYRTLYHEFTHTLQANRPDPKGERVVVFPDQEQDQIAPGISEHYLHDLKVEQILAFIRYSFLNEGEIEAYAKDFYIQYRKERSKSRKDPKNQVQSIQGNIKQNYEKGFAEFIYDSVMRFVEFNIDAIITHEHFKGLEKSPRLQKELREKISSVYGYFSLFVKYIYKYYKKNYQLTFDVKRYVLDPMEQDRRLDITERVNEEIENRKNGNQNQKDQIPSEQSNKQFEPYTGRTKEELLEYYENDPNVTLQNWIRLVKTIHPDAQFRFEDSNFDATVKAGKGSYSNTEYYGNYYDNDSSIYNTGTRPYINYNSASSENDFQRILQEYEQEQRGLATSEQEQRSLAAPFEQEREEIIEDVRTHFPSIPDLTINRWIDSVRMIYPDAQFRIEQDGEHSYVVAGRNNNDNNEDEDFQGNNYYGIYEDRDASILLPETPDVSFRPSLRNSDPATPQNDWGAAIELANRNDDGPDRPEPLNQNQQNQERFPADPELPGEWRSLAQFMDRAVIPEEEWREEVLQRHPGAEFRSAPIEGRGPERRMLYAYAENRDEGQIAFFNRDTGLCGIYEPGLEQIISNHQAIEREREYQERRNEQEHEEIIRRGQEILNNAPAPMEDSRPWWQRSNPNGESAATTNPEEEEYVDVDEEGEEEPSLDQWMDEPRDVGEWMAKIREIYNITYSENETTFDHRINGQGQRILIAMIDGIEKGRYNTSTGYFRIIDRHGNSWVSEAQNNNDDREPSIERIRQREDPSGDY